MLKHMMIRWRSRKWRLVALTVIVAIGIGAIVVKAPPVLAANCPGTSSAYFICPDVNGGNYNWDRLTLDASPDGTSNTLVAAGDTITAHLSYNPANDAGGKIYSWINLDANDLQIEKNTGNGEWWQSRYSGADGSPQNGESRDCPSYWFWGDWQSGAPVAGSSHYYNHDAEEVAHNDPNLPGSAYNGAGTEDGQGYMTCGSEGQAVVWENNGVNHGTDYRFTVQFKVNPKTLNEGQFCLRGYVATEAPAGKGKYSNLYARSSQRHCYHIEKNIISGSVRSDPVLATGKPLSGVRLRYSRTCDPYDTDPVDTNSTGGYSFDSTKGQQYCVYASNPLYNANASGSNVLDGTAYGAPSPLARNNVCNDHECAGRNFTYAPLPRAPAIDKVNLGEGTVLDSSGNEVECTDVSDPPPSNCDPQVLRPEDGVRFEVTIKNDIDATQNINMLDYIPLNIDPDSISDVSYEITESTSGYEPSGWKVDNLGVIGPSIQSISYGNDDLGTIYWGNFIGSLNSGSGNTPPQFNASFVKMPAYSEVTITWHGYVKSTNDIGVYPADTAYCNAGIGAGNYSNQGKLSECENKSDGLQGVINYASATAEGVFAPSISNITYNPIPGSACAVKTGGINPYAPDGQGSRCGVNYDKTIQYSTNPAISEFNQVNVNIDVKQEGGMGPLPDMTIRDQAASGINAAFGAPTVSGGNFDNGTRVVTWQAPGGGSSAYGFTANMVDSGIALGGRFSNNAAVCWPEYWTVGHPQHCDTTNPVEFIRVNVDYPFFSSEKGSVHVDSKGTNCGDIDSSSFGLRDNPGGRGWYVVSVSGGNLSNFNSISGYNRADSLQQCRSDLTAVLNNMIANNPSLAVGNLQNGKIWKINAGGSPYNLGATNVGTRSTIFVNGDIYISGNVTYANGQTLDNTGSLGVVATGNIYIDPNVTELSGAYYAKGTINTCWTPASNGPKYQTGNVQSNPGGLSVGQCSQPLRVNGMLMANKFRFNRTQAAGAGPSEVSAFTDRLFLATPPGFSSANSLFNPNTYSGERRPRY